MKYSKKTFEALALQVPGGHFQEDISSFFTFIGENRCSRRALALAFPSSRPSVESPKVFPVTTDGESGVVSNGVPDWVYEGEFMAEWRSHFAYRRRGKSATVRNEMKFSHQRDPPGRRRFAMQSRSGNKQNESRNFNFLHLFRPCVKECACRWLYWTNSVSPSPIFPSFSSLLMRLGPWHHNDHIHSECHSEYSILALFTSMYALHTMQHK